MLSALPTTLLALLFALPVFSEPTSSNDPFRAISLQVKKQPTEPICCLKPLTPTEPVDDGILLSFEEWKTRQLAMHTDPAHLHEKEANGRRSTGAWDGDVGGATNNNSEPVISPSDNSAAIPSANDAQPTPEWSDFSYSKVPITDRFNYASLDCSARVHTSHRSAKSSSSILSSKRDRYMLSPCDTSKENQFVVVELCDDIRIDTVQLANFEFFSGVFKDFTISVAKRYPTDSDGWTPMSSYRAKNIRGVQTFRPPTFLSDFYRFIRIDFHSHYGNEYYCPVSLLRVYGLTHLEEWKWEIWESESRAKQLELQKKRLLPTTAADAIPTTPLPSNNAQASKNGGKGNPPVVEKTGHTTINSSVSDATKPIKPADVQYSATATIMVKPPSVSVSSSKPFSRTDTTVHSSANVGQPLTTLSIIPDSFMHSTNTYAPSSHIATHIPSPSTSRDDESTIPIAEPSTFVNAAIVNATISRAVHSTLNASQHNTDTPTIVVSSTSPSVAVIPIPPIPIIKGGESIYRTILNRLTEVEINQTLYMRYIEQQNLAIRDVIKRLGEDVGRLEGITRAQSITHQRTLNDCEKQRYQLEMEYGDLLSRLELLSEEIVLEKRLGVAQLCLLLAVLVFLGLTRGSRAEASIDHGSNHLNRSVREWGKRHFKISGDWAGRFKGKNLEIPSSRSIPSPSRDGSRRRTPAALARPKPAAAKTYPPPLSLNLKNDENMIAFPSGTKTPLETIYLNHSAATSDYFNQPRTRTMSTPRSRAPSLRTPGGRRAQHAVHQRATTPLTSNSRPQSLQRSNSQGMPQIPQSGSWGSMNVPKSAKKWARTAHLHEVKNFGRPTSAGVRRSRNSEEDVRLTNHDQDHVRTPKEFDFERENDSFFSLPPLSTSAKSLSGEGPRAASSPAIADSLLMKPESNLEDGDVWVDTDSIDGSELDAEQTLNVHRPQDISPKH